MLRSGETPGVGSKKNQNRNDQVPVKPEFPEVGHVPKVLSRGGEVPMRKARRPQPLEILRIQTSEGTGVLRPVHMSCVNVTISRDVRTQRLVRGVRSKLVCPTKFP